MPFPTAAWVCQPLAAWELRTQDYLATSGNGLMFQLTHELPCQFYEFGRAGFDRYPVDYSGFVRGEEIA
jgi:hypothetical protein